MSICDKDACTACGACYSVCPKQCIEWAPDKLGFLYPRVHKPPCVECGRCGQVCPVNHPATRGKPARAYACWSLYPSDRLSSTSGGAASVLSSYVIENGGVVYGAAVQPGGRVCHIRVDDRKDLFRLKGSKYVQSAAADALKQVANDLESGKQVLFVGTPCQVAGLKKFLRNDHEHLITLDLVCHGVPSGQLLKDHVAECVGTSNDVDNVTFRESRDYVLKIHVGGQLKYRKTGRYDSYLAGFGRALFFRESCYRCPYAAGERVSDVTIGDFWGLGRKKAFAHDKKDGVSLLFPLSQKGLDLISKCTDRFFLEERDVAEAVEGNLPLRRPAVRHEKTETFRRLYPKVGFRKAVASSLRTQRMKSLMQYPIRRLLSVIKRLTNGKKKTT